MQELLDVLNKNGEKSGQKVSRQECYEYGFLHSCVIIWVLNKNYEILVQRRARNKISFGGKWDKSVGGGVDSGETSVIAAIRESREELGLDITPNQLEFIGKLPDEYNVGAGTAKVIIDSFVVVGDYKISDMILQPEEVDEVKYVSSDWIEQNSYINYPENSILGDKHYYLLKTWLEKNA